MFQATSRGTLLGAAAALAVALGDFGASWLWLSDSTDRFEFLARLIAAEMPIGAILGASLGAFGCAVQRSVNRMAAKSGDPERRERRIWPLPFVLIASPFVCVVAYLLFSGGSASRLAMRPLFIVVAALVLLAITYVALRMGRALVLAAPALSRGRARAAIVSLIVLYVLLTKINQHVLPGLYEYLHGALTFAIWLVGALALYIVAIRWSWLGSIDRRTPAFGLGTLAALVLVLAVDVGTLELNQTVRVALLSPRASGSRSLMLALGPVVALAESRASASAIDRARRNREQRRRERVVGPTFPESHVLLVTIDALRADHLGLYGYRQRPVSRELDRLAQESIVFERAYAQAPHSSYSLCTLMASEYLFQRSDLGLPQPEATLATVLRDAGFFAAAFYTDGIFHTDGERLDMYRERSFGFARRSHRHLDAEDRTNEVLDEIDGIVEAGEPPSLLWVHYFDVHEPYRDTSFGTADIDRYDGEIRNVDRALARLIRETRSRFRRPVIIAITADHGEEFRDHGGVYHGSTVYEEQVRVPLIVHVPGLAPRRVRAPVELIDVAPTLLGLVDVPAPPSMRGDDLRPMMTGAQADVGPAFASVGYKHMVVAWPYKLLADLRFSTFELYDLSSDPHERQNLADDRSDLVDSLRGEVRVWLDSLADENLDQRSVALHRGRLGDQGSVGALCELLLDRTAPAAMRIDAARLLASFTDRHGARCLREGLSARPRDVAIEAAVALAWLEDDGGRQMLPPLLESENDERRTRAAIGLGRLGDRAAVPALIDVVESNDVDREHRIEAIRLLGLLRDPRAVEPLVDLLDDVRLRTRASMALGRIGDRSAFEPLVGQLQSEHGSARESGARGLGQLGDSRAIPHLVRASQREFLPNATESLVRLGAIGRSIGGIDFGPEVATVAGLTACRREPQHPSDWDYLHRTTCETSGTHVEVPLAVAGAVSREPTTLVLYARRSDAGTPVEVRISIGSAVIGQGRLDGEWSELRFTVAPSAIAASTVAVIDVTDPAARLALDHLLLMPR